MKNFKILFLIIICLVLLIIGNKIINNSNTNKFIENNKIQKVTPPKKGPKLPWD